MSIYATVHASGLFLESLTYDSIGTSPLLEELKHTSNEETTKISRLEDLAELARLAFSFDFNSSFDFFHFLNNQRIVFRDITKARKGLAALLSLAIQGEPTKRFRHERNTNNQDTTGDELEGQWDLPLLATRSKVMKAAISNPKNRTQDCLCQHSLLL